MRFDASLDSLNVTRSESVTDLNSELTGIAHLRRGSSGHIRNEDHVLSAPPTKPFGIGKKHLSSLSNTFNIFYYISESSGQDFPPWTLVAKGRKMLLGS